MYLKYLVLCLCLVLCSCSSTNSQLTESKTFTKISWDTKLKMREVKIKISDEGKIILTAQAYENISKNIEDIYKKQEQLKNTLLFYESQM